MFYVLFQTMTLQWYMYMNDKCTSPISMLTSKSSPFQYFDYFKMFSHVILHFLRA